MSRYYTGISDIRGIIITRTLFRRQWIGHTRHLAAYRQGVCQYGKLRMVLSAGRLNKNGTGHCGAVMLGLLAAGKGVPVIPAQERIPGSVYR